MFGPYCFSDSVDLVVSGPRDNITCLFRGNTFGGRPFSILVPITHVNRWICGEQIENCFPYLSESERNILVTGND